MRPSYGGRCPAPKTAAIPMYVSEEKEGALLCDGIASIYSIPGHTKIAVMSLSIGFKFVKRGTTRPYMGRGYASFDSDSSSSFISQCCTSCHWSTRRLSPFLKEDADSCRSVCDLWSESSSPSSTDRDDIGRRRRRRRRQLPTGRICIFWFNPTLFSALIEFDCWFFFFFFFQRRREKKIHLLLRENDFAGCLLVAFSS